MQNISGSLCFKLEKFFLVNELVVKVYSFSDCTLGPFRERHAKFILKKKYKNHFPQDPNLLYFWEFLIWLEEVVQAVRKQNMTFPPPPNPLHLTFTPTPDTIVSTFFGRQRTPTSNWHKRTLDTIVSLINWSKFGWHFVNEP